MKLAFFRHGIAEERDGLTPDALRSLTEQGRRRTLASAEGLCRLIETPAVILASPKRRAQETAHLVREVFERPVETESVLADGSPAAVVRLLNDRGDRGASSLVLVGHEPQMSAVIELLIGGAPRGNVLLKKAGVALLDTRSDGARPGEALLEALLPPRVLRVVGE